MVTFFKKTLVFAVLVGAVSSSLPPDPCLNVTCEYPEYCVKGSCKPDPCAIGTLNCPEGQLCELGLCYTPDPNACVGIDCGQGYYCD
jgi:hypothetical protein